MPEGGRVEEAPPRLLMVSHCLLNPFSQVKGRRAPKQAARFAVTRAVQAGVGLIQLPCPEFTYEGPDRWAKCYEQYDTGYFRAHSHRLVEPVIEQLREYVEDGARVVGLIGVEGSPSCGAYQVYSGQGWGGCFDRQPDGSPWPVPGGGKRTGRGVFLEIVAAALEEEGWPIPVVGVPGDDAPPEVLEHFRGAVELMMSEAGLEAWDGEEPTSEDPAEPAEALPEPDDLQDWG